MITIKKVIYIEKKSFVMIFTVTNEQLVGVDIFRLCFFTGDEVEAGVGSQREGLSGVSSPTLVLN